MQLNGSGDWLRVCGLAAVTVVTMAGFVTEIIRSCQLGF